MRIYLQVYNFVPDQTTQKPPGSIEYEIDRRDQNEKVMDSPEVISGVSDSTKAVVRSVTATRSRGPTPGLRPRSTANVGTPRAHVNTEAQMETLNTGRPMPDSITRIIKVVVSLIVVGVALWLVNTYVPMAGSIRAILNVVVVVATCVLVLQAVDLWGAIVRLWTDLSHRISR